MFDNDYFDNLFDEKSNNKYDCLEVEIYYNNTLFMAEKLKSDEIIIGKKSSLNFVDIDISTFDINRDFSRTILKIIREKDKYYVVDISRNKVFLNKRKLEKDTKYELNDGDILVVASPTNAFGIKIKWS